MKMKRLAALAVVGVMTFSGCEIARVGARCNPRQGAARNNTHVLTCQNGRWKQTITIGEAAQIVIQSWPGSIQHGERQTGTAGAEAYFVFSVRNRAGNAAGNAAIRIVSPGLFVGTDSVTVTTNALGTVNTTVGVRHGDAGTYPVTFYGVGDEPIGTGQFTVRPGRATGMHAVSGHGQTVTAGQALAPFVFKVTSDGGYGVTGANLELTTAGGLGGSRIHDLGRGLYSIDLPVVTTAGTPNAHIQLVEQIGPHRTVPAQLVMSATVNPGEPEDIEYSGNLQSQRTNYEFEQRLNFRVTDRFGNHIHDYPLTPRVVAGASGASGTLSDIFNLYGVGWSATATANGTTGEWYVVFEEVDEFVFVMTNLGV